MQKKYYHLVLICRELQKNEQELSSGVQGFFLCLTGSSLTLIRFYIIHEGFFSKKKTQSHFFSVPRASGRKDFLFPFRALLMVIPISVPKLERVLNDVINHYRRYLTRELDIEMSENKAFSINKCVRYASICQKFALSDFV